MNIIIIAIEPFYLSSFRNDRPYFATGDLEVFVKKYGKNTKQRIGIVGASHSHSVVHVLVARCWGHWHGAFYESGVSPRYRRRERAGQARHASLVGCGAQRAGTGPGEHVNGTETLWPRVTNDGGPLQ